MEQTILSFDGFEVERLMPTKPFEIDVVVSVFDAYFKFCSFRNLRSIDYREAGNRCSTVVSKVTSKIREEYSVVFHNNGTGFKTFIARCTKISQRNVASVGNLE